MPLDPILGDDAGTLPNSGTSDLTMPNSGSDIMPNSGTENASNSGNQFVTLPLSSQLVLDANANEIRSATDKRARSHEITKITMAAPSHESTLYKLLSSQQALLTNLVAEVKELKSQTSQSHSSLIRSEFNRLEDISDEGEPEDLDDLLRAGRSDSDSEDDLISQIEQFYEQDERCSGKINERLAKIVNEGICARINEEKRKDLLAKHFKPANCDSLQVPRINKGIWTSLGRKARGSDLKLQNSQTLVCKAFYPLLHLMDLLMSKTTNKVETKSTDVRNALMLANDTFKIMQMAFSDLSQRRRDFLKPEMAKEFKTLCSVDNPVTSKLFGDDLDKQIKEITDARRVSKKVVQNYGDRNRRYSPYDRYKSTYPKSGQRQFGQRNSKAPFLERRQQPKMFRNHNQSQKK
jgi:hypothetical protein